MKKVCICGSRGIEDRDFIFKCIKRFAGTNFHLLSGGAKGVDLIAEEYANLHELEKTIILPDWEANGKSAGYIRNAELIDSNPDFVIAFWDGESNGTKHMIKLATTAHINYLTIFV